MQLTIREPGSAITHFIACLMAAIAALPLILKAHGGLTAVSLAVFAASMILLYGASTLYHSVNVTGKVLRVFRKIDHMMIFVLIAGSYTPVCLIVLGGSLGYSLLALVWGVAIVGMLVKALWITCPKWFSSIIYIAMGWLCLLVFGTLWNTLPHAAFGWLLAGGIIYTVGVQLAPQILRLARNLPSLCDGREHLPLYLYVLLCSLSHVRRPPSPDIHIRARRCFSPP